MKKNIFLILLLSAAPLFVFAQNPVTIDIPALIDTGNLIFLTGIGGLSVLALVAIIKRLSNATGWWVRLISLFISAGCAIVYLIPAGWNWLSFVILTIIICLAANGIHLANQRRNP